MSTALLVPPARTRLGFAFQTALFGAVYVGSAQLSLSVSALHGVVPPIWVPAGIALAGLLILGVRAWPAVLFGAFLSNLHGDAPLITASGVALGATLGAMLPAWLLTRGDGEVPDLERVSVVLRFLLLGVVAGPLISTTINMAAVHLGNMHAQVRVVSMALTWFYGYMSGCGLVTPLILVWVGRPWRRLRPWRWWEPAALALGVLGTATLTGMVTPVYYLLAFPLVAWGAIRFGARGATLVAVGAFCLSLVAVLQGHLPDPTASPLQHRLFFTSLHLAYVATGLLLASSFAERQEARRDEQAVEDAYRALIAGAPLAITGLDTEQRVTLWSLAAERLYGWRAEEVLGQALPTIPADRASEFIEVLARRTTQINGFETVRCRRDGTQIDVILSAWPLQDEHGRWRGSMVAEQDVTERNHVQRLQEATYRISHAALTAPDLGRLAGAIHEIVRRLMPARNFFLGLYDPSTDTLTFPYWADEQVPPPPPRRGGRGLAEQVLRTGRPLRRSSAVGSTLVEQGEVDLMGSPAIDWLGVPLLIGEYPVGVLGVQTYREGTLYSSRDQTILEFVAGQTAMAVERKRAEEAVHASEKRFRLVATTTNDVVYEWDPEADSYWWSDNVRAILGYEPTELRDAAAWAAVVHDEDRARLQAGLRTALEGTATSWRDEYRIRRPNGEYVCLLDRARIERRPGGAPSRLIGAMLDVTGLRAAQEALRRSEDQLRQAMKMEAVGRLAGGVAHDFNNLLTSVLGHADLALERLRPGEPLADDLMEIKAAGARAAALTQQLLAFSRKQVLEPRVIDLNSVVSGVTKMLRRTIGEDVELVTRLSPELGPVRADPMQMEQVLLNLAVNARDAMPQGGRLTLETANHAVAGVPGVRIRVSDSGVGMTPEVQSHLFEPFFTTKEVGKGTGLGLATVYGIVRQSGGTISVASTPGAGSTFLIDLPQVRGEPLAEEPLLPVLGSGGAETVLLVEDEEGVRNLTRRVLEQYGYRVLSAPHGEAALAAARDHQGTIDLLLTDVVMPGMSGPRLAEQLVVERPPVRCLFMSGYAASTLDREILLKDETLFLQKPFTTVQLLRRVRETLDRHRAGNPVGSGR